MSPPQAPPCFSSGLVNIAACCWFGCHTTMGNLKGAGGWRKWYNRPMKQTEAFGVRKMWASVSLTICLDVWWTQWDDTPSSGVLLLQEAEDVGSSWAAGCEKAEVHVAVTPHQKPLISLQKRHCAGSTKYKTIRFKPVSPSQKKEKKETIYLVDLDLVVTQSLPLTPAIQNRDTYVHKNNTWAVFAVRVWAKGL